MNPDFEEYLLNLSESERVIAQGAFDTILITKQDTILNRARHVSYSNGYKDGKAFVLGQKTQSRPAPYNCRRCKDEGIFEREISSTRSVMVSCDCKELL